MVSSIPVSAKPALPSYVEVINDPSKINWYSMRADEVYAVLSEVETRGTVYNRRHLIAVYKAVRRAGRNDIATAFLKRVERPYLAAVKKQLAVKRLLDLAAYSALYVVTLAGIFALVGAVHEVGEYVAVGIAYFTGRLLFRVIFAEHYGDED